MELLRGTLTTPREGKDLVAYEMINSLPMLNWLLRSNKNPIIQSTYPGTHEILEMASEPW